MNFLDLSKKYDSFLVPAFAVKVGFSSSEKPMKNVLDLDPAVAVYSVSVDRAINEIGSFTFTIDNPASENGKPFPRLGPKSPFREYNSVIIEMGYGSKLKQVICGTIESVEATFPENGISQLTIKGFDYLKSTTKTQITKPPTWGNSQNKVSYTDIINDIMGKGYKFKVEAEDTPKNIINKKQDSHKDFAFVKKISNEIGYDFYMRGNAFVFKPKFYEKSNSLELKWGLSLMSFSPRIDVSEQVSKVVVLGWDDTTNETIEGIANSGNERNKEKGQSGSQVALKSGRDTIETLYRPNVKTKEDADTIAKSVLESHSGKLVSGSGETFGLPEIEPGMRISITGVSNLFSKEYCVKKVTHSISSSGFKTQFEVIQNTLSGK